MSTLNRGLCRPLGGPQSTALWDALVGGGAGSTFVLEKQKMDRPVGVL